MKVNNIVNNKRTLNSYALEIRSASWRDLNALIKLEKLCFSPDDAWSLIDIISVLSTANTARIKVEYEGQMIAFAAGERQNQSFSSGEIKKTIGWITTIAVAPDFRIMGIGTKLLSAIESALGTPIVRLSVRRSNQIAIQLYHRNGYETIDVWKDYYIGHEDALIFEKKFDYKTCRGYNVDTMELLIDIGRSA